MPGSPQRSMELDSSPPVAPDVRIRAARPGRDEYWRWIARKVVRSESSRRRAVALRNLVGQVAAWRPSGRSSSAPTGSSGNGSVAVWYVPHPDDDALFMAGSLHDDPAETSVAVLLTRGGASSAINAINKRLDRPLDLADFMAARTREFRASMTALGVQPRHVFVHDLPDGGVAEADVVDIVREMARRFPDATHHAMTWRDPHPDHAAAGQALRRVHGDGDVREAVFHVPVPLMDESFGTPMVLSDEALAAKRASIAAYTNWDPRAGSYAVATHSVRSLVTRQSDQPVERVHGPDL